MAHKLSHAQILERQSHKKGQPRLPFCVLLNNIRSLYNVGSIFRTADGAGVERLYLCGITGHPPNKQISKTALGAEDQVAWEHKQEAGPVIRELKRKGYAIVLLEQTASSVPYHEIELNKPVCLVLGNEVGGVDDEITAHCDQAVEIEMDGIKNSLNVSVAFGIVAYHVRHLLKQSQSGSLHERSIANNHHRRRH